MYHEPLTEKVSECPTKKEDGKKKRKKKKYTPLQDFGQTERQRKCFESTDVFSLRRIFMNTLGKGPQ